MNRHKHNDYSKQTLTNYVLQLVQRFGHPINSVFRNRTVGCQGDMKNSFGYLNHIWTNKCTKFCQLIQWLSRHLAKNQNSHWRYSNRQGKVSGVYPQRTVKVCTNINWPSVQQLLRYFRLHQSSELTDIAIHCATSMAINNFSCHCYLNSSKHFATDLTKFSVLEFIKMKVCNGSFLGNKKTCQIMFSFVLMWGQNNVNSNCLWMKKKNTSSFDHVN